MSSSMAVLVGGEVLDATTSLGQNIDPPPQHSFDLYLRDVLSSCVQSYHIRVPMELQLLRLG